MGLCIYDRLVKVFDGYVYGIKVAIDEGTELGISDKYFEGCNYDKIEGLVTGLQDGINGGVGFGNIIFDGK